MLSKDELARLRSLLERATPGPWQAKGPYLWDEIVGDIDGPDDGQYHCTDVAQAFGRADATLLVEAVNALPTLLRIAEAVADAPIGLVAVGESRGMLEWWNEGGQHDGCPTELHGQRVRLVRIDHGRSGEEGNG